MEDVSQMQSNIRSITRRNNFARGFCLGFLIFSSTYLLVIRDSSNSYSQWSDLLIKYFMFGLLGGTGLGFVFVNESRRGRYNENTGRSDDSIYNTYNGIFSSLRLRTFLPEKES